MSFSLNNIRTIAISNRAQSGELFFDKINEAVADGVEALILREKDLSLNEYLILADNIKKKQKTLSIYLHSGINQTNSVDIIRKLINHVIQNNFAGIHFTMKDLKIFSKYLERKSLTKKINIGVSIHSVKEAIEAEYIGVDYMIAGHVFETDCKPGIEARGLSYIKEICKEVSIPFFAIGGIKPNNAALTIESGAAGVCVMSGYFKI